jgi:hypothetical protein
MSSPVAMSARWTGGSDVAVAAVLDDGNIWLLETAPLRAQAWTALPAPPVQPVAVHVESASLVVIVGADGSAWQLEREPTRPSGWQELPPIPGTAAAA